MGVGVVALGGGLIYWATRKKTPAMSGANASALPASSTTPASQQATNEAAMPTDALVRLIAQLVADIAKEANTTPAALYQSDMCTLTQNSGAVGTVPCSIANELVKRLNAAAPSLGYAAAFGSR